MNLMRRGEGDTTHSMLIQTLTSFFNNTLSREDKHL
jgi:hypothetical protein